MLDSSAQADRGTERKADDVGLGNVELVKQRGNVVAHGLERKRAVRVRRAAVALQFDRDHLVVFATGSSGVNISPIVIRPPCSRTSGSPCP